MESEQMVIADYEGIKQAIRNSMTKAVISFVEIGFYLKKMKEEKLYIQDGYRDIWEAAENEFGLKRKQAWSFMNINDKYSVNGNSLELQSQYAGFSKSTLTEMLTLPEKDYELITKDTKIEDIRELKQAEQEHQKEEDNQQIEGQSSIMDIMPDVVPETEKPTVPMEITTRDAIRRIFQPREEKERLNKLCRMDREDRKALEYWVEDMNPSGNRMDKVMPYFVFFYKFQDGVKIKNVVTGKVEDYTYSDFQTLVISAFGEEMNSDDIWKCAFGAAYEQEKQREQEEKEQEENRKKEEERIRKEKEELQKERAKIEKEKEALKSAKNVENIKHEEVPEDEKEPPKTTENRSSEPEIMTGEVEPAVSEPENEVCDTAQSTETFNAESISDFYTVSLPVMPRGHLYKVIPYSQNEDRTINYTVISITPYLYEIRQGDFITMRYHEGNSSKNLDFTKNTMLKVLQNNNIFLSKSEAEKKALQDSNMFVSENEAKEKMEELNGKE